MPEVNQNQPGGGQNAQPIIPLSVVPRKKEGAKWGAFWWTLSITVHVAVVVAIVWFTPLREWFLKKTDRHDVIAKIPEGRGKKMVDYMLTAATNRLRAKIEEQRGIAEELQRYCDRTSKRYFAHIPTESPDMLGSPGPSIDASLKGKNILELYDIAKNIEITAHGYYRQLRTVELARIQGVALPDAVKATKIAIPQHPPLNANVFGETITSLTDGKLEALQAEIDKARVEVGSMVAAQQRMLDMIKGIMGDDVGGTIASGGGGGVWVPGDYEGGGGFAGRRDTGLFQGYTPANPHAFSHPWGEGIGPVTHKDEVFPIQKSMDLGKKLPAHGRKLISDGSLEQNNWMFVDSWYIVGPFPNPNREKIDYAFPPESSIEKGIDLDAVYIGWDGKPVQWLFRMANALPVVPHRPMDAAIWYAYTEIYAETDQERLCIFGSDDYGKAWMNGEIIFMSGKTPHPWIPDRGIKKVQFKKGFNPVLFKLENAWGATGFSMCIFLGDM